MRNVSSIHLFIIPFSLIRYKFDYIYLAYLLTYLTP